MASENTRTKILDVAERLFAEEGFAATSLRTITAEAGVNLASVNYHFGSKDALLFEVLGRRLRPMNKERLRLLDEIEAEAGDKAPDPEKIVRAFLEPALVIMAAPVGDQGANFMRLLGRMHVEVNDKLRKMFLDQFIEVIRRFTGALNRLFPELSVDEARLRLFMVVGVMAHVLAWGDKTSWLPRGKDWQVIVTETLVQFATAGVKSSVPAMQQGRKQ